MSLMVEDKALALSGTERVKFLTDYSSAKADEMLVAWHQLAIHLIVKYNDMISKPEQDGIFTKTPEGLGATVKRPGYPVKYARELIKQTGKKFEFPN